MRLVAQLYTRPGCHLCEAARAEVERQARERAITVRLELIDVDAAGNAQLLTRYGERVPVLVVGSREYAAPLLPAVIGRALEAAAATQAADERGPGASAGLRVRLALEGAMRHWIGIINAALAVFLAGALAAPVLAKLGADQLAIPLYGLYHLACHQWAFRSFFFFGPSAIYSEDQLAQLGLDPFTFIGSPAFGYKMALCERDIAIYAGLLGVGLLFARRAPHAWPRSLGLTAYSALILPMAIDGFTQLFGWRESTWELRVATGLLFGVASAWLLLPRLDHAFRPLSAHPPRYAPAERTPTTADSCHPHSPIAEPAPAQPRG